MGDDAVTVSCSRCQAEQEDYDGFGVLYCEACHYCAHPSATGTGDGQYRCDLCGALTEPSVQS